MQICKTFFGTAMLMGLFMLVSGCATTSSPDNDPFERVNRRVWALNQSSDRYILKPVAKAYQRLPSPVRGGVGNFFSNLAEPYTVVNDLLQGKFAKAGRDTGRFVINTTLGFFGLNDVATHLNIPRQREDFGQTLAVWGVPPGPYIMLPFFGPSNVRDSFSFIPDSAYGDPVAAVDETPARYYGIGIRVVNTRAGLLGLDQLLELQPDQYLFVREGYRQRRQQQIYNGQPPQSDATEDDLLDELLEEEGG